MFGVSILGTATVTSGRRRTTEEVGACAMPHREPEVLRRLTGIDTRYWIEGETSAVELGARAIRGALERAGQPVEFLRRVVFVSSTGGDWLMPANANWIIAELGLDGRCDGFDLNNACTGFLNGFEIAAQQLHAGGGPVAVVVVETLSRFCKAEKPRPYMVFGDAAVATVFGPARGDEGVLATHFGNIGAHRLNVHLEHPERAGALTWIEFASDRHKLLDLAFQALGGSADKVLESAGLKLTDIEHVVPHQPNGAMLEAIIDRLGRRADQVTPIVADLGSIGAASLPGSLDRLYRTRPPKRGDRILLTAVGAGMSYGAVLHQVG